MFFSVKLVLGLLPVLLALTVCRVVWQRRTARLKIAQLGGRSPVIKTYLPLAVDFLFTLLSAISNARSVEFWRKKLNNHLTVEIWGFGAPRTIFTTDPENIKAIHATQFHEYGKGERMHQEFHDFLGDGIFTTDGAQWSNMRQLVRPLFMKDKVQDFDSLKRHTDILLEHIPRGQYVKFDDLIHRFTLDAATEYLFGESVNSLGNPNADFAKAFNDVQKQQMFRLRLGPFKELLSSKKLFLKNIRTVEALIEPYIQEALSYRKAEKIGDTEKATSGRPDTFVHALAEYTSDRAVLRDNLLAMLLAGRDTTACLLSFCMYELSRNPDIYQKLRAEVLDAVQQRDPTYKDLKDIKYLSCIINETLRLYPPVPFNVRSSLADTTLPQGGGPDGTSPLGVLKDTQLGYLIIHMHRNPMFYPPRSEHPWDPLEWCPDRWLHWTPKPWHFLPFGGGPRICIGQNFATTEASYVLARFVQMFEKISDGNSKELRTRMDIILLPVDGVRVAFDKST